MKFTLQKLLSSAVALCAALSCLSVSHAAEPKAAGPKDSQSLLLEMRLKRWNKELEFTTEQQAKVRALLDEENKAVARLDEDKSLAIKDRANKVDEIHNTTYAKIKPLLTEKQVPAFEKLTTKSTKSKKPAAVANP